MCGILGSINIPFDTSTLEIIKHRGPDDFGLEKYTLGNNVVQLSQRRLSIIDLSPAGHQPMNSECNNYALIFNGEIYNHQELREKLPADIKYRGHSDTETILYYLKEFGMDGIKDFNGIFAIAFLDKINNKLCLARDPFGVKPLYYFEGENNTLAFSSEIGPLKALLPEYGLNKDSLATLLRLRYNPSPDTIYAPIKKVRPGHYFEIDMSSGQLVKSRRPFLEKVPVNVHHSEKEDIKLYGAKLEEAVKRQLLSDVEVGVLLSGGIDSAMVAALAQKHSKDKLKAFTIGFESEQEEDEVAKAAETARILGLDHHYKRVTFLEFIDVFKQCARIVEEPLATTSMIPMFYLSELASKYVKVVLTGQGADEPLGGYFRYKSELIQNSIPGGLQKTIYNLAPLSVIQNERVLRGINAFGIKDDIERFISEYEIFSCEEIRKLISVCEKESAQKIAYFYELLDCKVKKYPVERMMALDARMNLSDDLLNYTDKITMHFSIECRVPMLDIELVKFIETLDIQRKVNFRKGKIIHRQFARELLPAEIINRKKNSFQSPTNYWFRNEINTIKDILLTDGTNFAKIFNQQYIAEILNQHQKGYNKEKQIFMLLSICFCLNEF